MAWLLRPSFSPVWGACSGAVMASSSIPNPDTQATREGTAAHWVASETLEKIRDTGAEHLCSALLGATAPNGVVIDDKMVEGAQVFVDEVLTVATTPELRARLLIEHEVTIPSVHEQNGGTLDCALYLPERDVLFNWDYKHGHRECDPVQNNQFIEYLEGLRIQLGINDLQTTAVMRVVQPFCYTNVGPVHEWRVNMSDLRGYVNALNAKAHEALAAPTLTPGKHCRDCPAVFTCAASRRYAYRITEYANEPYEMDAMSGTDLAVERGILKDGMAVVKARLEAIEADLEHRIAQGESGTGLALESGEGHLAWTIPAEQAAAMASQFGFDISKKDVMTPTQAKNAAPVEVRPMFSQVLDTVTKRPSTGLKLVNASDSRTAKAFTKK